MAQPESGVEKKKDPEQERQVHTVEEVTMEGGVVDFRDRNGVVSGNIYQGGVIRGDGDVLIQGAVKGEPQHPCKIEVAGAAVMESPVVDANITARRIVVHGDVAQSKMQVDLGAEVSGDLMETEVSLGNRTRDIHTLRHLRLEQKNSERNLDELKVRIGLTGRRFVRDYPQVELKMGYILVPTGRELRVDLKSFYKAVSDRDPEAVDRALEEFYLRVMVGSLTRVNRHYISRNPSRHKIFLKLIEDLRLHIMDIRQGDKLQERITPLVEQRQALLKELEQPAGCTLRVGGEVGDAVVVQLLQLHGFQETSTGSIEMEKSWVEAKTVTTVEGRTLEVRDLKGKMQVVPIEAEGLRNGTFALKNGSLVWRPAD